MTNDDEEGVYRWSKQACGRWRQRVKPFPRAAQSVLRRHFGGGCFFDGFTLLALLTPLLLPTLKALDIDLIHFAVILTANIEIASITPPVGFNLFVISGTSKVSIMEVARGVVPFCVALLIGLVILTYVPSLSLVLLR